MVWSSASHCCWALATGRTGPEGTWRDPAPPWLAPPHPLKCRYPWRTEGAFQRGQAVRGALVGP